MLKPAILIYGFTKKHLIKQIVCYRCTNVIETETKRNAWYIGHMYKIS